MAFEQILKWTLGQIKKNFVFLDDQLFMIQTGLRKRITHGMRKKTVATVRDGREINRMFLTAFAINSLAT